MAGRPVRALVLVATSLAAFTATLDNTVVAVAVVELRGDAGDVAPDDLLADAGRILAAYELPTEIRIVDELPRTDSGKVDLVAVGLLLDGATAGD